MLEYNPNPPRLMPAKLAPLQPIVLQSAGMNPDTILFQNDDFIAVDKPDGLAAIPESDPNRPCLLKQLEEHLGQKLYIVHRLDKEVSGVILFARHAEAHKHLNDQFSQRHVNKTYLALVHGDLQPRYGVIDQPIRQFGSGRMGIDPKRGKPSRTEFKVLERLGNATLVEAKPITGRRHQLRVHFYSLGHPLVGDRRYGDKALQSRYPRLMLHARQIEIQLLHGEKMVITAPLPTAFRAVIEKIKKVAGSQGSRG